MAKDNGGQAFPCGSGDLRDPCGMTLRDWFAGQALAGIHARDYFDPGLASPEQRARICYLDADALLAERNKEAGE